MFNMNSRTLSFNSNSLSKFFVAKSIQISVLLRGSLVLLFFIFKCYSGIYCDFYIVVSNIFIL